MARIEEVLKCDRSQDPTGTKTASYSEAKFGPFRCDRCSHYAEESCNHPVVMADPEIDKNEHGDAIVEDGGCCKYFRKKEK